ncbi:MAG: stage III sporulation protein AB [Clostridia bacterium]|nr:stage III sporulation protein AB [Clostridia bacterium]
MTTQIAGAVLILGAVLWLGMGLSAEEKRRGAELGAFCHLLEALRNGIASASMPVSDICLHFSDETLAQNGFLPRLHELCREQAAAPLSRAFSEHRAECGFALSEDEAALFSEFASGLGQEDSAGEVRRCDYYLSLWRARLSAAEDGLSANTRILRTLPLACGGLLILLFV